MSFLCELVLYPNAWTEDFEEDLIWLASLLEKSGRALETMLVRRSDHAQINCIVPLSDAMVRAREDLYIANCLDKLNDQCSRPMSVQLDDASDGLGLRYLSTVTEQNGLYLYTRFGDLESPLRGGRAGNGVPLYVLPLHFEVRERILFWQGVYKAMARVEFNGYLERETCYELHDPHSHLSIQGRGLAQQIEDAAGIPVYYFIPRYYGRSEGDSERLCSGCGSEWHVGKTGEGGLGDFPFRCESCRLISEYASDTEDDPRAALGEWVKEGMILCPDDDSASE